MRIGTRATVLALVTTSTLAAPAAYAQKPAAPAAAPAPAVVAPKPLSETLEGAAKADYESGKLLFGDGDHAGALVKFSSAYEKSKDARLLWNMAACEKNLRHYSRSLRLLRRYLDEGGDKLTAQDRAEAEDLVKVMEPLTAKLLVAVNEPGADVFVDDENVGQTPAPPVVVDIGQRKVRVAKEGFEEFVRFLPVTGSAEIRVDVNLEKIVHEGRLTVKASEGATIELDNKVVGTGTFTGVLPSGGHMLRVSAPKMRPYQSEVIIADKQTREVGVTLEPEPVAAKAGGGLPTWAWIAGGVLVAGGLTAGGVALFGGDATYNGPTGNLQGGIAQANRGFWR